MRVAIRIHYQTNPGENLFVAGSIKGLGKWDTSLAYPMIHNGNGEWEAILNFKNNKYFCYKYLVKNSDNAVKWEGGNNRIFSITTNYVNVEIRDYWREQADNTSIFFSKMFTEVFMNNEYSSNKTNQHFKHAVNFSIRNARVPSGFSVGVIGNNHELGKWEIPRKLIATSQGIWETTIPVDKKAFPLEYKYVIINNFTDKIEHWEDGNERSIFCLDHLNQNTIHLQNDENFRYPIADWKGAGVAVPIFALRTDNSFGVGEFYDLKKLIDWCCETNLKVIQLLPINETVATHSWLDSYPYKSISVFALHPIYLNLKKIGTLKNERLNDEFDLLQDVLNAKTFVDYVEVTRLKSKYYKLIFDQDWKNTKHSKSFISFFESNKSWLEPYAAFCFLRDRYKTSNFKEWSNWSDYKHDKIKELVNPRSKHYEHIAIHYFIQYHLDKQLSEVVEYAHSKKVALKGDIPIGISANSIDAWTNPELFNLNAQAGAPPDDFAVLGQNWGFPTYNWEQMKIDGYKWWKNRLTSMTKYFDAYRIDHILGFFRIWEIPIHAVQGLLGYFNKGLPYSIDELANHGIWFDKKRFTEPYIRSHFLHEYFGEYTNEVKNLYLNEYETSFFEIKPKFSTQRKIFNHFTPENSYVQEISEKNIIIRDGLMALHNEVLFIKDPYTKHNAYHPRIAIHSTNSYRELDHQIKERIDELYIDFFYHRHEEFWKNEAIKKLPEIVKASSMLVCGEDLGMVPNTVPDVLHDLNILSLEVQRMPKDMNIEFAHPKTSAYLSICTTSTHDMSTIRGWWEENRERTQRFFHSRLEENGAAPYFAEPWVCQKIIKQHLKSPAVLTIFPIQDIIAMDGDLRWDKTDKERINVPSDEKNKWRYRMILSLEELQNAQEFNSLLSEMISNTGRNSNI